MRYAGLLGTLKKRVGLVSSHQVPWSLHSHKRELYRIVTQKVIRKCIEPHTSRVEMQHHDLNHVQTEGEENRVFKSTFRM